MESTKGMDPRNLPGSLKAAILIQALGKEASQKIISGLTDVERKIVHDHLNQMGPVAPILVENVAKEFSEKFDLEGHTTSEVQQAIRWVETHRPWIPIDQAVSLSDLRYRCRRINLLDLETPVELQSYSRFAWIGVGSASPFCGHGTNDRLCEPQFMEFHSGLFSYSGVFGLPEPSKPECPRTRTAS